MQINVFVALLGIVRIHANLQGVEEVSQTEKELVDKITYQLRNQTTSYVDYILQLVQLRLIGVTVGHSVVCHFHCPGVDDYKSLRDKLRSRELEKSLDTVFRTALPERHIAGVAITSVDCQHTDRTTPSGRWQFYQEIIHGLYGYMDYRITQCFLMFLDFHDILTASWCYAGPIIMSMSMHIMAAQLNHD